MADARQRIFPMLAYDDAPAAIDFLCSVFSFHERYRMNMPDGVIGHAELVLSGNVVMLATRADERADLIDHALAQLLEWQPAVRLEHLGQTCFPEALLLIVHGLADAGGQ